MISTRLSKLIVFFIVISFTQPVRSSSKPTEENGMGNPWHVSFGIEGMSFYGSKENGLDISNSPFASVRSNLGASAAIGKWITPVYGVRLKGSGYWGKDVFSESSADNAILFYSIQAQGMFNVQNKFLGVDANRFYSAIPYAGLGFVRNCDYISNSLGVSVGIDNTFRISNHLSAHFDVGANFAGKENPAHIRETGKFKWFSAVAGLTFNIGNLKKKTPSSHEIFKAYTSFSNMSFKNTLYSKRDVSSNRNQSSSAASTDNMVLINRGHIRMGMEDMNPLWGNTTPVRDISVDDFWMDKTEVTNAMYHEFINDIINTIIEDRMNDPQYHGNYDLAAHSLYITNPVTGERHIDASQLNYAYEIYDYAGAALRQNRLDPYERNLNTDISIDEGATQIISKDTAYIDDKGRIVSETITRPLTGAYDFLNTYAVNVYPDTTVWVNDFPKSDNTIYMRYYFSHKDYADYPVVGITWEQANAYCSWRTEKLRQELGGDLGDEQPFRLPTEAEWEFAARGTTVNEFPWEQHLAAEGHQRLLANFQPAEGNYTQDGNIITSKVGIFPANRNGLFDMAGNVAEWTSTSFTDAGVEGMNNINPQHDYRASAYDAYSKKKKSVRGGSWKDSESHIKSAWRSAEYQNQPRSYIGFRCVRSIATKPTERFVIR